MRSVSKTARRDRFLAVDPANAAPGIHWFRFLEGGSPLKTLCPIFLLALAFLFQGCETTSASRSVAVDRAAIYTSIQQEEPGDYWIGRRYYKRDYHFWGYVRRPREPWSTARMVMLNEQQKLAPDRAMNLIGSDNDYEYKLAGYFSGDTVYEPASNGFYPEFVLKGAEVRSIKPLQIYTQPGATDPSRRIIAVPVR